MIMAMEPSSGCLARTLGEKEVKLSAARKKARIVFEMNVKEAYITVYCM
jgi:hypothetical protein